VMKRYMSFELCLPKCCRKEYLKENASLTPIMLLITVITYKNCFEAKLPDFLTVKKLSCIEVQIYNIQFWK
jgi:hypothetical protein